MPVLEPLAKKQRGELRAFAFILLGGTLAVLFGAAVCGGFCGVFVLVYRAVAS